ncbi:MAG: adenylate/guanylate cyclase domain-containing protein [Pseudomonadota bacterium]
MAVVPTATEGLARGLPVRDWLLRDARFIDDHDAATMGLVQRLTDAGVPLDRMATAYPTLHAERRGLGRIWTREDGVRELEFPWGNQAVYEASPYHLAHQTREWVRVRLDERADTPFEITDELRAAGYSDYVCVPVFFQDDGAGGVTFATRLADGFADHHLDVVRIVEPALAMLIDLRRAWQLFRETLGMYVGVEPRDRILSGQVQRGDTLDIRAAVLFADMQGFTSRSSSLDARDTVALLNRFFDCIVSPIESEGGEVLKYLGDGVLAIFNDLDDDVACRRALNAAISAHERVVDGGEFGVKLALHHGSVAFGNVGSGARLDYTVIGRDVNIASRLADLCSTTAAPLVASAAFARRVPSFEVRDLGDVTLRGVIGAVPVVAWQPRAGA